MTSEMKNAVDDSIDDPSLARILGERADILRPLAGQTIALIAPAGGVKDQRIDSALALLQTAGIDARLGPHAREHHRYLAGTTEARLADLYWAFDLPGVSAVWCLRGGYGCAHLVNHIDWSRIPADVPLIGYSDITTLLAAFDRAERRAIHGATASDIAVPSDDEPARQRALQSLVDVLDGQAQAWTIKPYCDGQSCESPAIFGQLVGGNLTTLASLAGTSAELSLTRDSLLMLEDVGEAEFRLERCLHQLLQALDTSRLKAVILGEFVGCKLADDIWSLAAICHEWCAPLGIPIFTGAPFGHGCHNHAWAYGITSVIDGHVLAMA